MDSLKAKLKRAFSKHGSRDGLRSGGSEKSSTVGSTTASTRGSHDGKEGLHSVNGASTPQSDITSLQDAPAAQVPAENSSDSTSFTPASNGKPHLSDVQVHSVVLDSPIVEVPSPTRFRAIPYSTLTPTAELSVPNPSISVLPPTPTVAVPSSKAALQPTPESSKLWEDAYRRLRKDQRELVHNYEIILKDSAGVGQGVDLREEVARVVACQKERMENGQWTFQWNDKPQKVRDIVHRILKITDKAACFIDMGMEYAPPYVSLPWAAIGAILPFAMSGFEEEEEGISGLEKVAQVISSYRIVEDAFLCNAQTSKTYSEAVIPLYMKVLEYQAIAAQYFGRHTLTRFGASIIGSTDWKGTLSAIDDFDDKSRRSVLHLGVQAQQAGFAKMQDNFSTLIKMFDNRDEVLRSYLKEFFVQKGEVDQLLTDLSTIPYKQDHRDVRKELGSVYYGSGQWFLNDETVSKWREWEPGFNILWLVGSVGTGKSSLTSMLLEELAKTPSGSLAFFYCSRKASKNDQQFTARDSVENVLRTLIIQLSMSADGSSISEEVREYHSRSKQGIRGGGMEISDCIALLESIVAKDARPRITIVIDALDECTNFPKLLEILQNLFSSKDSVRIYFSSRFEVDVKSHFEDAHKIVIEQQNGPDILTYIDTEISDRRVNSGLTDGQAAELKSILMDRHEGMFIWVVLVIDDILDENEEDRLRLEDDIQFRITSLKESEIDAENMLQTAYDSVYAKAIGKGKQPTRQHVVEVALKWTICSFRPLTLAELTHASSIKADGALMDIQGDMILAFCSNLLVEGSGGIIRFAHLSVKHYLEHKEPPDYAPLEAHAQAATASLLFLKSPQYHEVTTSTLELSYKMNSSFAKSFSSYAKAYWFRHCQEAKQNADLVDQSIPNSVNSLEKLISDGTNYKNPDLLRRAIRLGNDQTTEKCIAANVNLEVLDEFQNTVLHDSVRWNRLGILERLINVGSNLNTQNRNGDSPLHFAAFCGFVEILQALISAGANRNSVNHKGETPLHIAVIHNHRELVRILLAAGADKTIEDKWANTPVHYTKAAKDLLRDTSIFNLLSPPKEDALVYAEPQVKFPGLCGYCNVVRWISVYPKTISHTHWPSYHDLKASASGGCTLCGLLLHEFEALGCQNLHGKGYPTDISVSIILVSRQKFPDTDNDIIRATMGGTLKVEFELCLDPKNDLGPLRTEISGRMIAQSPTEQSCFDLVKSWLAECAANHSQCTSGVSTLPTRIIDVGPEDGSGEPFLHLTKPDETGSYIYLSAKRGGHLEGQILLSSNLNDLVKAMPLSSLPKTYHDAVLITRRLGIRYLFIDAYCIFQDTRDDWVAESAKMGDYLKNSTFTLIAASVTTGCNQGIYQEREFAKPLARLACTEIINGKEHPWTGDLCLRRPTMSALEAMQDSVLQRGWMVQELVLPERNVIFGNEQIYWNCQKVSRSEDTIYYQNPILRLNGSVQGGPYQSELIERWYHMVEIYSGTIYNNPRDRLPGLSHMVQHMLQQIKSRYHAGLWESNLLRGLLWRAKSIGPANRFEDYIAPSWSWASFHGPVSYTLGNEDAFTPNGSIHPEILDLKVVSANTDPTGAVKSGMLKLLALSKKISKNKIPNGCNFYFDDAGYEDEWRTGAEFVHVFMYEWVVNWVDNGMKSAGLMLQRVSGDEEQYRRVGLVTGPDDLQESVRTDYFDWETREFVII